MPAPAQRKGMETEIHPAGQGEEARRDGVFATVRPIHGHPQLCNTHRRPVGPHHRQNQRNERCLIHQLPINRPIDRVEYALVNSSIGQVLQKVIIRTSERWGCNIAEMQKYIGKTSILFGDFFFFVHLHLQMRGMIAHNKLKNNKINSYNNEQQF